MLEEGKLVYAIMNRRTRIADVKLVVGCNHDDALKLQFNLASVSKPIMADLALRYFDEVGILLDSPLSKFLPTTSLDILTIRNLIGHETDVSDYFQMDVPTSSTSSLEALSEYILNNCLSKRNPAGYSNSNYVLLAYILQKTSGRLHWDLLQEKLARPIGLKSLYSVHNREQASFNALKFQHPINSNGKLCTLDAHFFGWGDGDLVGSGEDVLLWMDSLPLAQTPNLSGTSSWRGWSVGESPSRGTYLYHFGSNGGGRSWAAIDSSGILGVCLSNDERLATQSNQQFESFISG
jgi:CubicO group peptidase (beta-lactamase class C family)